MGVAAAALGGYAVLDSLGVLGPGFPIRRYITSLDQRPLSDEASKYGDDGDRIAYAANYLRLSPEVISDVFDSWSSTSSETQACDGQQGPHGYGGGRGSELSNEDTASLAMSYPNLLWAHAHANALFAFPWITYVQDGDPRLMKMADLSPQRGPGPKSRVKSLDLHYPEGATRQARRTVGKSGTCVKASSSWPRTWETSLRAWMPLT